MTGYRDFPMPALIEGQAREWLATPEADRTVAEARPSSTVMLLREGEEVSAGAESGSVEVFFLRRVSSMPFAPGMIAFPGGGVDGRDADPHVPWVGPSPHEWSRRMGVVEDVARELVIAAARELFEECGVLLAGSGPQDLVEDVTGESWQRERSALLDRSQSFGEMLTRLSLVLRTDLLSLRAHWTTPVCEPRRYDTRFFAARMPRGQVADDLSSEAEHIGWASAEDLLAAHQEGREVLLPPTQVMVEQLLRVQNLDAWLTEPPAVHRVMPWPVEHSERLWMRSPIDEHGHGLPQDRP